nr:retrovirus-related Pol polyprotein from transposon TNT 1-94 [Tanacetum cinerariifolium]
MTSITSLCKMACTFVQKKIEEKQLEEESESLDENIISGLPPFSAITPDEPVLSTEEPDNSLSMGGEHLDTISAMESDEFIKSSVENLIPIPSESEGIPDHMCDVPFIDNSSSLDVSKDQIEDFSESNEEFSSTDVDSFSFDNIDYVKASPPDSELVSSEVMEIVIPEVGGIEESNDNPIPFYDPIISGTPPNLTPLGESDFFLEVDAFLAVEDEFTSSQFPTLYLDPEGDMLLFEIFLDDDNSSNFKTKSAFTSLNSLLEETNNFNNSLPEFTTFLNVLCDAKYESDSSDDQSCSDEDVLETIVAKPLCEEEIIPMKSLHIRLIEKLLYDNSSPRPPKEFVSANSDAASESFSPSHILVKDSDSLMEEIDLFFSVRCQKPGHLAAGLGCAETKVATWDDLAFKIMPFGLNVKHLNVFCKDSYIPADSNSFVSVDVIISCDTLGKFYHPGNRLKRSVKTPYELLTGDKPAIGYLKPFGCQVIILNTSDYLGKFDEKADEGYIVGYSIPDKAYRVYNLVTGKIVETINIKFLENLPSVEGTGQPWLFDIDYLTDSLNYARIRSTNLSAGNQGPSSNNAGCQDSDSDSDDEHDVIIVQNSPTSVTTPVH